MVRIVVVLAALGRLLASCSTMAVWETRVGGDLEGICRSFAEIGYVA